MLHPPSGRVKLSVEDLAGLLNDLSPEPENSSSRVDYWGAIPQHYGQHADLASRDHSPTYREEVLPYVETFVGSVVGRGCCADSARTHCGSRGCRRREVDCQPRFHQGRKDSRGSQPRLEPRADRGSRLDVHQPHGDERSPANLCDQGDARHACRRGAESRRCDFGRRREPVFLRPADRIRQSSFRRGGVRRQAQRDAMAGARDGECHDFAEGVRRVQCHGSLQLQEVGNTAARGLRSNRRQDEGRPAVRQSDHRVVQHAGPLGVR
jgi:hypothetical protein